MLGVDDRRTQKSEVLRCKTGFKYFINSYGYIMGKNDSGVQTGKIPFRLFPFQREVLDLIHGNEVSIILKARQLGISWIAAAYALWVCIFRRYQRVVIISVNEIEAQVFLEKVKFLFDNLPEWMKPEVFKRNEKTLWFGKRISFDSDEVGGLNSRIDAVPASKNAGTSRSLNLLILDEAAKIEYVRLIWKSAQPALAATDGHAVLISTMTTEPTGDFFEEVWHESEAGKLNFVPYFIPYNKYPGRNREWLAKRMKDMPASERSRLKQEHPLTPEDAFQAMGGKFFDVDSVKWHKGHLSAPVFKGYLVEMDGAFEPRESDQGNLEIWEWPEPNEEYVWGGDPAEGIEQDGSAGVIVRKRDEKVCAVWHSNTTPPDEMARDADKICRFYNFCLSANEVNNTHGGILNITLKDLYFNLYYHDVVDRDDGKPTKRWGWLTTGPNRGWILDYLDKRLRQKKVQLSSDKLWQEISDYIINPKTGRGMHKKGKHDDILISLAIALWVIKENPYVDRKLEKAQQDKRRKRRPKNGY